jgi:hypothetical protein
MTTTVHSLTVEFDRPLNEPEWRELMDAASQLPFAVRFQAHAETVKPPWVPPSSVVDIAQMLERNARAFLVTLTELARSGELHRQAIDAGLLARLDATISAIRVEQKGVADALYRIQLEQWRQGGYDRRVRTEERRMGPERRRTGHAS